VPSRLRKHLLPPTQRHWIALGGTRPDEENEIEGLVGAILWGFKSPIRHGKVLVSSASDIGERHHIPVWVCKQIENAVSLLPRHVSSQCNSGRAPLHYHRPGAWWVGRRCLYRAVEQRLEAACHAHDHLGEAEMDGPSSR
jgi:hypothetical protein